MKGSCWARAIGCALLVIGLAPAGRASAFPDQPVLSAVEIIDSPMYKSPDLPKPIVEWVQEE